MKTIQIITAISKIPQGEENCKVYELLKLACHWFKTEYYKFNIFYVSHIVITRESPVIITKIAR